MLNIRHAAHTDPGPHKKRNEDRFFAQPECGLFFVTDGMANEVTPELIVESLPGLVAEAFEDVSEIESTIADQVLRAVVRECSRLVRDKLANRELAGMLGATLVLM